MKTYRINEIFRSPQGEGYRQGQDSIFVRFAGCNLRCRIEPGKRSPGGFDCDTEFMSGVRMTAPEIYNRAADLSARSPGCGWVVFTGGEPMLQLDEHLVKVFMFEGWCTQIETNGTRAIPPEWLIDFITVSPKVAEHALRQTTADEVKYVRGYGQAIPRTRVQATHHYISPAFEGGEPDPEAIDWCQKLIKDHPSWKLSVQMHKAWGVR